MANNNNSYGKGLSILGRYGIIGVMLGLILLAGFAGYGLYNLATNHIGHAQRTSEIFTEAFNENTKALIKLEGAIRDLK